MCEYNLRGLSEPRCPECGYQFEWADLTDPARRRHPYLFEHHPRHNLWSFWRTVMGSLRPGAFWSALKPSQPSNMRRLILYWVACVAVLAMGTLALHLGCATGEAMWWVGYAPVYGGPPPKLSALLTNWQFHMGVWSRPGDVLALLSLLATQLLWPWITFALLMIFQQSMRRVRVRPAHVLRCIIYSMDTAVWVALGLVLTGAAMLTLKDALSALVVGVGACWLFAAPTFMWRLCQSYRRYLQFDHPVGTVLVSQGIGVFALAVVAARLGLFDDVLRRMMM